MENIKTVLISNFSLPFLGIGSWTSMINYHISNGCSIDYLICPKSEILVKKPKQYFMKPQNNFDKIKIQLLGGSKFNKYLHKLNEIFFLEKYIIIQVIDNVGLMFAIIDFVQKRGKRKNVYLQFFYHGYQPFFKSELIGVSAFSLSAVGSLDGESGVTDTADFEMAVGFLSQSFQSGFHSTTYL